MMHRQCSLMIDSRSSSVEIRRALYKKHPIEPDMKNDQFVVVIEEKVWKKEKMVAVVFDARGQN
jgi:hypothetical protein